MFFKAEKHTHWLFVLANTFNAIHLFVETRGGLILGVLMLALLFLNIREVFSTLFLPNNRLFLGIIAFQILSCLNYVANPFSAEFLRNNWGIIPEILSYLLVPQLFFFWVGNKIGHSESTIRQHYLLFMLNTGIAMFLSILIYVIRPTFYITYLLKYAESELMQYGDYTQRLSVLINGMAAGITCATCLVFSLSFIKNTRVRLVAFLLFGLSVAMTLQRGAWVSALLGLGLFGLIQFGISPQKDVFLKIALKRFSLFFVAISVLVGVFLKSNIDTDDDFLREKFVAEFLKRFDTLNDAYNERSGQVQSALYLIDKFPLHGVGYGLLSHKAADRNQVYAVPDSNYHRLFAEIGIPFGLIYLLFFVMAARNLYRKRLYALFVAYVMYLFQAIGTNVFDLYYSGFAFWLLTGIAFAQYSPSLLSDETNHSRP